MRCRCRGERGKAASSDRPDGFQTLYFLSALESLSLKSSLFALSGKAFLFLQHLLATTDYIGRWNFGAKGSFSSFLAVFVSRGGGRGGGTGSFFKFLYFSFLSCYQKKRIRCVQAAMEEAFSGCGMITLLGKGRMEKRKRVGPQPAVEMEKVMKGSGKRQMGKWLQTCRIEIAYKVARAGLGTAY